MPFLHLLAGAGIGAILFAVVRWIGRQSVAVQVLVASGLVVRAVIGVALFWISYLQLPVMQSLQLGTGFWSPMLDGRGYFDTAAYGVEHGLGSISPYSPSPFFTKTLAVWMRLVGVAPSAGMLLNLCAYVGCCAVLTRLYRPLGRWRADLPLVVAVAALSFCPVLLLDSTQPLKDDVFLALIVVICASSLLMFQSLVGPTGHRPARFGAALCALALATYGAAGIRAYYPMMVILCLAPVLVGLACASPPGQRVRRAALGTVVLVVVWCAHSGGGGTRIRPSPDERHDVAEPAQWNRTVGAVDRVFQAAASAVHAARYRFIVSGGDTNIGAETGSVAAAVGIGLAIIVVPVSILKATSLVNFEGGRGLLLVTDADTLFMDCSLIGIGVAVVRRRRLIGERRVFVWFALGLAALTAILLGYVVTNFGTLFRMRYLVSTPLWMLALAVSPAQAVDRGGR